MKPYTRFFPTETLLPTGKERLLRWRGLNIDIVLKMFCIVSAHSFRDIWEAILLVWRGQLPVQKCPAASVLGFTLKKNFEIRQGTVLYLLLIFGSDTLRNIDI